MKLLEDWKKLKERADGAVLLVRIGDWFEAFFEDAQIVSNELGLTLTKRNDVPMSGIVYHQIDGAVEILKRKYKVAIADYPKESDKFLPVYVERIVKII